MKNKTLEDEKDTIVIEIEEVLKKHKAFLYCRTDQHGNDEVLVLRINGEHYELGDALGVNIYDDE